MRSFFATLRQLVLPAGAQPGAPRIVMGPDIPPEMVAWATPKSVTFLALQIYYYDATHYRLAGIGTFDGIIRYFEGTYDPINTVYITSRTTLFGGSGTPSLGVSVGTSLATFPLDYKFINTNVSVDATSVLDLAFGSRFTIDGTSQPRGLFGRADATSNSAAVGAEAVILTTASNLYRTGRAWKLCWEGPFFASVANQTTVRVRRTGVTGAILAEWYVNLTASALTQSLGSAYVKNASGLDISDSLVLTIAASVGTTQQAAAPNAVRMFEVWDAGAAVDYPNAIQI